MHILAYNLSIMQLWSLFPNESIGDIHVLSYHYKMLQDCDIAFLLTAHVHYTCMFQTWQLH